MLECPCWRPVPRSTRQWRDCTRCTRPPCLPGCWGRSWPDLIPTSRPSTSGRRRACLLGESESDLLCVAFKERRGGAPEIEVWTRGAVLPGSRMRGELDRKERKVGVSA